MTHVELAPVLASDLEELVVIRIIAMRPSLERLGRFDPARARARIVDGFDPSATRFVLADGEHAGFLVVKAESDALLLEHLYVRPPWQGRGIGGAALAFVLRDADEARRHLRVTALRDSDSNRFYARHGFAKVGESEWDIHYARPPRDAAP